MPSFITSALIKREGTEESVVIFGSVPEVWVTFDTGREERLFSFYPDEIEFTAEEFIGLTREQALDLRRKKDVTFLRA